MEANEQTLSLENLWTVVGEQRVQLQQQQARLQQQEVLVGEQHAELQRLRLVGEGRQARRRPRLAGKALVRLGSVLVVLLVTLSPGVSQAATILNTWDTTVAPMSTARGYLAAATGPNGRIYAIGGDNNPSNAVEAYDTTTNTWSTVASMPTARGELAATTGPDGRIYAIGGYNGISFINTVEAYDTKTNTWSTVASMPTARDGLAAVTGSDGRIYAIGGYSANTAPGIYYNTVEAYDTKTNTWSTMAPMPTTRGFLAAATGSDGRIYAIGGTDNGGASTFFKTVEAYDPTSNTWSTRTPMPTGRWLLAAARGADGKIYAFGDVSTVVAYDAGTNTWSTVASMSRTRVAPAAATGPDGRIYAIGGGGPDNTVEAYPNLGAFVGLPGVQGLTYGATPLSSPLKAGVYGSGSSGSSLGGIGVEGVSDTGIGVLGQSTSGNGIEGITLGNAGAGAAAVYAHTDSGYGVHAIGFPGFLAEGANPTSGPNTGLHGRGGRFASEQAQIRLMPASGSTPPANGAPGDFYVTSGGSLYYHTNTAWVLVAS